MAGYPTYIQQQYENDPRRALVAALMQQAQQQQQNIVHPLQGLSSIANTALGSYRGKKLNEEYAGKTEGYNKALAAALGAENPEQALQFAQQNPGVMEQYGPAFMQQQRAQQQRAAQRGEELADAGVKRTQQLGDAAVARQQALDDQKARFAQEEKLAAAKPNGADPYNTPIQSSTGFFSYDNRTGKYTPAVGIDGAPILPVSADPALKGRVAEEKAAGNVRGETQATAAVELPRIVQTSKVALREIDALLKHPGLGTATGFSGTADPRNYIAGTDAKNAQSRIEQLRGKTFLEAYTQLKGGGAISEAEGAKAESAIARLDRAQSTEEFKVALTELGDVINAGMVRAMQKSSPRAPAAPVPPSGGTVLRFDAQGTPIP